MFTLITLSVLALLAGATFTVKNLLNKKREAISHTRKVYPTEVLNAILKFKKATIKHIKRKKITKSKHTKRFI